MRRQKENIGIRFYGDFQQVTGIQPQNRPSVRSNIADAAQRLLDFYYRFEIRGKDYVVHFAHAVEFFVDAADLRGQ